MSSHRRYMQYRKDELYHYNHNHDPKNGRFTSAKGVRATLNVDKLKKDLDTIKPNHDSKDGEFTSGSGADSKQTDNQAFLNKITKSRDFSIAGGDLGGLAEYMLEYDQPVKKKFLESEKSYQKRRREAFDNRMAAYWMYTDTSKIADKKQKAAVESRIFKEASGKSSDVDDFVRGGISIALTNRIQTDGYFDAVVKNVNRLKPASYELNTYKDVLDYTRKNLPKSYKDDAAKILNEAGFEDTEAGRNYVNSYLLEHIAQKFAYREYEH